jgi:predicted phosphatase
LGLFKQILARSNTVWSHDSLSDAAKPFHDIIPIGPMNDEMDAQQHLNAEESHAMRYFDKENVKIMGPFKQILARSHTVWSHDSLSVAAKPFHIIPIGPMNEVREAQQHLKARWSLAVRSFDMGRIISLLQ